MEYCNLIDLKKFEIAVMKKFSELQENSGITLMSRRSYLPKRLKLSKRSKQTFWS